MKVLRRLKPWTLRWAWHRLLLLTPYYEWRHKRRMKRLLDDGAQAIADHIDAEGMRVIYSRTYQK